MRALALTAPGRLELVDTAVPAVADNQVLVETRATTICTSDIIDIDYNPSQLSFPTVLGHEGSGTVVAVGEAVRGLEVGQRVATHPVHPCYHCVTCAEGNPHLCPNMQHFGLNLPGTFAEFYVARSDRVRVVGDTGPVRTCLAEPLSVCLEALAQARLAPGSSLLILGDGPFGVMMARLAQGLSLRRTVLAGWDDFRLTFAHEAVTLNTKGNEDPVDALLSANGGLAYDAAIAAVGSSEAVDTGLRCLKPKGRLVLFSAFSGNVSVDLNLAHRKELELLGACNDQNRFDEAVELLPDASWSELVTHSFAFGDYAEAFELVRGKENCLKVALVFEDGR